MDRRKLTINEFNELTSRMKKSLEEAEKTVRDRGDDPTFSQEEFVLEFYNEYLKMQNELLSYDLSDISFENWKDVEIAWLSEEDVVDFSGTHANIDFDILRIYGKANYKGCNIRNLEKLYFIDEEYFDKEVVDSNPDLFLSNSFSEEFKRKYYDRKLTIEDVSLLSNSQLEEFKNKNGYMGHFENNNDRILIRSIGIERIIELYKNYPLDYKYICELTTKKATNRFIYDIEYNKDLNESLKKCDVSEIRNVINEYGRSMIKNGYFKYRNIRVEDYTEEFINDNKDLFLLSQEVSDEIREKFYNHELSIRDVVENIDLFKDIDVSYFMRREIDSELVQLVGIDNVCEIYIKHIGIYNNMLMFESDFYNFARLYNSDLEFDIAFSRAVKNYFLEKYKSELKSYYDKDGNLVQELPDWMSSIDFKVVDCYKDIEKLQNYDDKTIVLDDKQRIVLDTFGVDNIIRFDKETGYFSRKEPYKDVLNMDCLGNFLSRYFRVSGNIHIALSDYDDFTDFIANCFDDARQKNFFSDYPDYGFITGTFREKYKHIFIDTSAPTELINDFYKNRITPSLLNAHREYIPYLLDKKLENVIKGNFLVYAYNSNTSNANQIAEQVNFIECYSNIFGNKKLLELLSIYGELCDDLSTGTIDFASKETILKSFRNIIYKNIINSSKYYEFLSLPEGKGGVPEFVREYPDIFIDARAVAKTGNQFDDGKIEYICRCFYNRKLSPEYFYEYPELIEFFKDKNLKFGFGYSEKEYRDKKNKYRFNFGKKERHEVELVDKIGNEKFLKLCSIYGRYLRGTAINSNMLDVDLSYDDLCLVIEDTITKMCKDGDIYYMPSDAPEFLKRDYPDLFLSEDAPEELKKTFYSGFTTFDIINENPNWLPYLKGKAIELAFIKGVSSHNKQKYTKYFKLFGREDGLKLGLRKTETVTEMITSDKIDLMYEWYVKTGKKFIPDYVVMQGLPEEDIDKFLVSASKWSTLMKNKEYAKYSEGRDVLLKLAYTFGVFEQDQTGMKKLQDMIGGIPKVLSSEAYNRLLLREKAILDYEKALKEKNNAKFEDTLPTGIYTYEYLREELNKMGYSIENTMPIFSELFSVKEDGTAVFKNIFQGNNNVITYMRKLLETESISLNVHESHRLFGGFECKYDKEFREFLLANLEEIRNNTEYSSYVAGVQRQFGVIKAFNSNRHLTLDLAISFVQNNKYTDVEVGNDRVAEVSSIAGYTQEQFDTLQKIYNYGKQRVFSSIPRIENKVEGYSYEILRLDDPLAMAIGTLTDCCQELGDAAEVCMEHSMVDNNGRVFVIRDDEGNIIAQSWVWRNKDVICFDNIEIPHKAFKRANNEGIGANVLADKVYEIYKMAASELIKKDEEVYKRLLDEGKITKEEYNGLRLGKVTVGIGYNDIASSLKRNAKLDSGIVSRPLPFEEPVPLQRGLYTNDSVKQYVLEERKDRKEYKGNTMPVHSDNYIIYNDDNFGEKQLLTLEKLELVTNGDMYGLNTSISDYGDKSKLVSSIASNYGLDASRTRIVMNANFAIIYEEYDDTIKIADIFYNVDVMNMDISDKVVMQIRIALEQIGTGKKVDVSSLEDKQMEMYKKATLLNEELDIERGTRHGK